MKTFQLMLAAALMVVSGLAIGGDYYGPWGYGPYGYGEPYGQQGPHAGPKTAELDPADADARAFIGADGTGFGQWADSNAGAQQPGQGAPWSGIRPPK